MKTSRLLLFTAATLLAISKAASAAPDIVACDLLDEPAISALIGVKTKPDSNRYKEVFDGVKISNCMFRSERQSVMVTLAEYSSNADANKSYMLARKETAKAKTIDNVKIQYAVDDENALGDKAYWYRLASEQFGLTAIKGNRGLTINIHFDDEATGTQTIPRLKERSRPLLQAALRKI
ncbi:hypothetical protein [Rhodoferax sp.]|uniref:hypothetical protein n=1 Tax=Rhodoferax sp. TaxID=50421 RepID=UPI002ACE0BEA|nr:hypothetical protein [Rhodoferax sp.]MDZ7920875.1 hypothetical protein [Rhodoferax sp.]